jgi:hypothetical protein
MKKNERPVDETERGPPWVQQVIEKIRSLWYGKVVVIVQCGKVVRIERTEQHQLDN